MSKERIAIIVLLASLLVTNLGWFYMGHVQNNEPTSTNEFERKLQELRNEKCSLRLLYQYTFEEYKQNYESTYTFTEVDWAIFKEKIIEYEDRNGVKAATVYPDERTFEVGGVNSTQYYHKTG